MVYTGLCTSVREPQSPENMSEPHQVSLCVWSPTCYCNVAVDVGELLFQQDELRGGRLLPLQLQHYVRVMGHFAAFLFVQGDVAAHDVCKTAQKEEIVCFLVSLISQLLLLCP